MKNNHLRTMLREKNILVKQPLTSIAFLGGFHWLYVMLMNHNVGFVLFIKKHNRARPVWLNG